MPYSDEMYYKKLLYQHGILPSPSQKPVEEKIERKIFEENGVTAIVNDDSICDFKEAHILCSCGHVCDTYTILKSSNKVIKLKPFSLRKCPNCKREISVETVLKLIEEACNGKTREETAAPSE
ncbi:MAG: hypothetical protein NC299_11920 [Lachnospiraceae bacterium]|nr:hypothetical protein [Lachnospiraceae bacterium]